MEDIAALMRPQALAKGLEFKVVYHFPLPENIYSDAIRLKQILLNLCSNALKFTEFGYIKIDVAYDRESRLMRMSVSDTGIGLSAAEINKIFQVFSQADSSTTRKYGGTGLGLSLSQRLAGMLGGTIEVTSVPDIGSQFVFTTATGDLEGVRLIDDREALDLTPSHAEETQQIPLTGRVLLVEDTKDNQALLSLFLRKMGVEVSIAENGLMAVAAATTSEFDLIFMDMQMPVMDGMTAVKILRENGYTGPIVALTANAMQEYKTECIQAGCNDFLSKPVDQQRFYEIAKTYLLVVASDAGVAPISPCLEGPDPEFRVLVENYILTLPAFVQEMVTVASAKDWTQLRFMLHKLRGTGGGYGFRILTEVAGVLYNHVQNGQLDQVKAGLAELQVICESIQASEFAKAVAARLALANCHV